VAGAQAAKHDRSVREAHLATNARRYDVAALVAELRALGYHDDDIEFRSNQTTRHQDFVVDSVAFQLQPSQRAVITVNLGLLGAQSFLPSYFQQALDKQHGNSLSAFLNFFSHRMIRADVMGMFPERDPGLFADFAKTRQQLMSLLGLRSPATVHWLFQAVYPELEVSVRRTVLERDVRTHGMVIGAWSLGDGTVCGGITTMLVSAISVRLFCDEPETGEGVPWARAAVERLHAMLFPILQGHGLFLEVSLVLRDQSSIMVLSPKQYLGYQPMHPGQGHGKPPREPTVRSSRTVTIWSGEVPRGSLPL
jgi:hypothetical protein